jgi:hypothetical protein
MRMLLVVVVLALLGAACASIQPLVGGEKDEVAPALVEALSTPNYQTNVRPSQVVLSFDEWVVLEDVFNQVVVSPPLQYKLDISLRGRKVLVQLDEREQLRDDATYTINFGVAVKDLTERNPAKDLRFVFATGSDLDSLVVEGVLEDAFTGEPIEKAMFMLYDELSDTVVRTQLPFYFGRSEKDGRFRIPNVRADTMKGFALLDADFNYLYNQPREKIGFPDTLVNTTDSLGISTLRIRMFEAARPMRLLEAETSILGRIQLLYSRPVSEALLTTDRVDVVTEYSGDTVRLWYAGVLLDTLGWRLEVEVGEEHRDTLMIKPVKGREVLRVELPLRGQTPLHPDAEAVLQFSHPVLAIDTSLMTWSEDSLVGIAGFGWRRDSTHVRRWLISRAWQEGSSYALEAMPGAFTDLHGQQNADTIRLSWRADMRKQYGIINLILEDMEEGLGYVLELLNSNKEVVRRERVTGLADQVRVRFGPIIPGQYALRVITDSNGNGRWDTGDYEQRRQPEEVMVYPLEQLRGNWELESRVRIRAQTPQSRVSGQPDR